MSEQSVTIVPGLEASVSPTPTTLSGNEQLDAIQQEVRGRLLHALSVYPFLSNSLLHMAIGTGTMTSLWRPVLTDLCESGAIRRTELSTRTPGNRAQTYILYHLPDAVYTPTDSTSTATLLPLGV